MNNEIDGKVEIACGPESVLVNFNTLNNFEGHVYVKVPPVLFHLRQLRMRAIL